MIKQCSHITDDENFYWCGAFVSNQICNIYFWQGGFTTHFIFDIKSGYYLAGGTQYVYSSCFNDSQIISPRIQIQNLFKLLTDD
jgi:hypothetical protein